jgi:hypothetical protein
MSVVAKGPPYMTEDEALYYKGFGVHKPIIPEVEKRKQEIVFKKPDLQTAQDWWLDSQFADGTTVREALKRQHALRIVADENGVFGEDEENSIFPELYESVKEMTGRERERKTLRELVEKLEDEDRKNKLFKGLVEEMKLKQNPPQETQVGGTHYSDLSIQPWDAMRAWFTPAEYASYHIGSVIGYLSRHRKKGGLSDIKKAHHHLSELIRYFEEEEEYE